MGKKGGGRDFNRMMLLAALSAAACGRTTVFEPSECAPGDARICSASGALGAQTCTAFGYWSECNRASSSGGSGSPTGSGGSSGSVGTGGIEATGGTTPGTGGTSVAGTAGTGEGGTGEGGGGGEGGTAPTVPTVEFGRTIGEMGTFEMNDLAATPSGVFAIAAATYNKDLDFGAPTPVLIHEGGWDAVVAEFEPDGSPMRATLFGKGGDEVARSVAYDANGALITAETHAWSQQPGVRLKRTSPSGDLVWSKFAEGYATAEEVAVDTQGNVVLTGVFDTPVDFGGGALPTLATTNTYVVKFDDEGNWLWGREFIGYHSFPTGVATDSGGNVLVVGNFAYDIDFGAGVVDGAGGSSDLFVVKLSPTGELLFADTYAGNNFQYIGGVAVLSDDSFAIAGRLKGDLDLGLGSIHGSDAILVSRFSAAGQTLWAKAIEGTSGDACAYDVAVDPSDNIVLVGSFQGTLLVPNGTNATKVDAFVIGLNPAGDVRWTQSLGGPGVQEAFSVATDAAGNVFVGGRFSESIDFGDGPVSASGTLMDLFVAKIVP